MGINYSTSLKDKFVDTVDKFHTNKYDAKFCIGNHWCKNVQNFKWFDNFFILKKY